MNAHQHNIRLALTEIQKIPSMKNGNIRLNVDLLIYQFFSSFSGVIREEDTSPDIVYTGDMLSLENKHQGNVYEYKVNGNLYPELYINFDPDTMEGKVIEIRFISEKDYNRTAGRRRKISNLLDYMDQL